MRNFFAATLLTLAVAAPAFAADMTAGVAQDAAVDAAVATDSTATTSATTTETAPAGVHVEKKHETKTVKHSHHAVKKAAKKAE